MATNWDDFQLETTAPAQKPEQGAGTDWSQFELVPQGGATPKGVTGHLRDAGLSLLQGAIGVPEAAVGLADIATGGQAGKFLENEGGPFGFRPKQAREFLDTLKTDTTQQQKKAFEQADGIVGKTAYALQNPSLVANAVVESAPMMGFGGVVGRGVIAAAPKVGAAMAGAVGEGVAAAGSSAEKIRQETADGTLTAGQSGLAAAAGVATAGFGALGAKVAQRLGIADADTLMVQGAKGLTGQAAQQAAVKGIPRKVIEGAIAEGFLEELPQSVSEQVLQNIALNKDWSEGVDSAVVLGVLSGMAMGGGAAGLQGASQSRAAAGAPQETPAPTPVPANPSPFDSTAQPPILNEQALEQAGVMPPPVLDADRINQAVDLEAGAPLPFAPTPAEELATMRKTAMGIDPAAGPLSAGAAIAVESQAAEEIRLGTAATMAEGAAAADQARLERDAWQTANPGIPFERIGREDYDTLNPVRLGEGELLDPQAGVPATVESGSGSVAERWEQMTPDQRRQIVRQVPGIAEIVSRNLPGAEWGRINPDLQKRISRAVDSGASGSGGNGGGSAGEWSAFPVESGTLNVPRAAMPQIKAEHRGAMVNFMNARGVQHREETVPAASLKPTQAEFSREKVARAKTFEGGSRSILVSADNHVLDGHHQWMAARDKGEDVKVIRLDAPIRDLVGLAHDFPSSTTAGGSASEVVTNPATPVEKSPQNAQIQPETRAVTGMAGGGQSGESASLPAAEPSQGTDTQQKARESADDLQAMSQDAGWQEVGGRLVRSQDGTVSRTKWLPRADWFMAGMESDSAKLSQDIARLVAGQRVSAKSRRTIEGMMDWLDAQRGTAAPNEDASAYDFEAAGMGVDASEDALMIGDIFAEVGAQDDAATMRALGFTEQEIQDAVGQQADRAGQGGARQADAGRAPEAGEVAQGDARAQGEARGEGGQAEGLTSYTNEDIARQEAEQKARSEADAAAQRAADQKAQADADRGSFTLTGSDRAADVMAAQGQGGLFDATQEAGTGYTVEERKKAKRDDYTQDLFGNAVPDTLGGAGVGQQSASAENRNLLAASSVPGAVFATVTGARQTGELKTAFPVVDTASKAAHTFAGLRKRTTEHFAVLVLNAKGEPIAYSEMFSGGTSATSVYPDAVAKFVYGASGAASFWVSHNHPSGSPTPSNADVQLTKVLSKAYGQGTGIEMAGHVVIAGGKASLISRDGAIEEQGFAIPAMPRRNTIPIMRRDILRLDTFSDSIASPAAAKVAVRVLSGKESGVVFLNAQNAPVAFLPMSQATMVRLRDGKSARELFGAAARSNASAAMIHLGAQHSRAELEAASQNLHDALSGAGDIRILDAFLDEGDKMYSLAESGEISGSGRGVFMSRAEPRSAAPKTITAESLPGIFAERFPKLAGTIKTMLDRGTLGQPGGLVVIDSNDEAQIAREFADRTGRSFDDTVQLFAGAGEDINAFYDPESGLTFMVGPNLSAESLPAVVLHEMVHGQQRQALDQKALALIDGRAKQAPALRAFLDRVAERMEAVGETGNPFEATSYIVEMAVQEGQQSGFSRADGPILAWIERNIGRKVADLVRDFVAMARAWALSHGVTLKSIAVDDLVAYAMAGVGKAARGRVVTNEGTSSLSRRQRVSPENLPDAFVANPLGAAAGPDHDAAKAGDREAALRLARRLVTPELLEHVRRVAPKDAVVVGVASIEATGRNALPAMAAARIAHGTGLELGAGILQANRPKRTTMDGLDRVFGQAEFDGPIEPGKSYVLVDDTLTQGGTFAALASHIEQNGGHVAAVVALTGKQYSSRLMPDSSLIQQLRNTHGDVESSFERATGYGFDGLTASEARYLANFKPADTVRARILAAVAEGDPGLGDGAAGPRFSRRGNAEGLNQAAPESARRAAGRPRPDPNDPFSAENTRLREHDKSLWQKAKGQLRRWLAPGGLLPETVFAEKIKRDSEFQAVEFDIRHIVGGFEQAVKQDFGVHFDKLSQAQQRTLSEALAGKVAGNLPEATKTAVVAMRQYIDTLSGEYLQIIQGRIDALMARAQETGNVGAASQAINEIELYEKIRNNVGAYVHRSYQAFDDPKWFQKVPTATLNAARQYLKDGYMEGGKTSEAEALRLTEVALNEILKNGTAYDSMEAFISEGKLGAKDLSVLMRRKDVPPVIRALLGEYTDPRLNFTKSATKMGRLIWNQRFLDRVRDMGLGTFLFEGKDRPPMATTQIAAQGSEVYAPLNGLWTFPEVAQAFKDALGKEQMGDLYRFIVRANGLVKYGKTVLSPTTAMRNWQSAMFFALANGHFDLTQMKKSVAAFREQVRQNATGGDLAYLRHLKELGVVYDTPYAGEMMRFIEDAKADNGVDTVMRAFGASDGAIAKGLRGVKQINQVAQGFYSFGDDFWKIIGFENEKAGLLKAGLPLAEAEREAAKRIRDTYPTYSMVGAGIQKLSRFPLMGTFVSFPAEIVRTSANMLRTTAADLKSDNPALRALGMKRAVGMAMVSGLFYALAALSKSASGVDDDEEEALRDLAPEWQKNSTFLFAGRNEKGQLRYFDMSFLDPYGYWKRPITAMLRDQPWEKSAASALKDMLTPFFGADIATAAIFQAVANKKDSGGKVYQEGADAIDQAGAIANHLRKALQPGFVGNIERLTLAAQGVRREGSGQPYDLNDEMTALLGWRASTMDPKTALYYRSFEFNDAMTEARQVLTRTLRSVNPVSQEDIRDARGVAQSRQVEAFTEMRRLVQAAQAAGMNPMQIRQVLKQSSISQANAEALMRGTPPRLVLTVPAAAKAVQQARAMEGPEFAQEVARRYRMASGM